MGAFRGLRAITALLAVFVTAGCAAGSASGPLPTRPTPTTAASALGLDIAPLTGKVVAAGTANNPSIAVKIDNLIDARPQWALNQTDLVYEELVEGGITRYVAVWQSMIPTDVGPVRSIRPMDPDIVSPLGGLVAYSGGQDRFVAMIQAAPVVNVSPNSDSDLFYRTDARDAPHNELLKAQAAVAANSGVARPQPQFSYGGNAQIAAESGTATTHIALSFSSASQRSWDWDASSGVWLRSQDGVADTAQDGTRVQAVNVLTLRVAIDWSYGIIPKTILVSSGEADVSVAGKTIHGRWSKASQTAPIVLTASDGSVIRLAVGNTWIELVPDDGSASFQ